MHHSEYHLTQLHWNLSMHYITSQSQSVDYLLRFILHVYISSYVRVFVTVKVFRTVSNLWLWPFEMALWPSGISATILHTNLNSQNLKVCLTSNLSPVWHTSTFYFPVLALSHNFVKLNGFGLPYIDLKRRMFSSFLSYTNTHAYPVRLALSSVCVCVHMCTCTHVDGINIKSELKI